MDGIFFVIHEAIYFFGKGAKMTIFDLWLWCFKQLGDFFVAHAHEGRGRIYIEPVG